MDIEIKEKDLFKKELSKELFININICLFYFRSVFIPTLLSNRYLIKNNLTRLSNTLGYLHESYPRLNEFINII